MGMVAVVFKIYAKDGEFEKALASVKTMNPAGSQVEEIGFGIKVIKALFKFEDKGGGTQKLEEGLRKLDGVSEVEVYEESLVG
ncbi:MAG: elongation factor 1-beta [Candidatus Marsarchaeota archaeon]|nr:elongation factor 1-beta [Candidatus Marsarchaeota archaeon]